MDNILYLRLGRMDEITNFGCVHKILLKLESIFNCVYIIELDFF